MSVRLSIATQHHTTIRTVLILAYLAGLVGLHLPLLADYFRPLSPITLIGSLVILLLYHADWRPAFYYFLLITLLISYLIELLGIHTGVVFGQYAYGHGLGPVVWGVPPVVAINWLLLTYCCGSVCDQLTLPVWVKIGVAATTMVILDVFIEPVAIRLDFWTWFGRPVPIQNYLAWWLLSAFLFTLWYSLPFKKDNRLAKWLLIVQFIFFVGQTLLILF